ncbi:MAG: cupin domain-containing protein [Betaproteobacteria bacterium]|jgi:mannose-6-phosphate isomerase-like protein (cupin superfamily)
MTIPHHHKLPYPPQAQEADGQHYWALLAGSEPQSDFSFKSKNLQIIYNNTSIPWTDASPHAHSESDEVYIVQEGLMAVTVDGVRVEVKAGEFLCIPAGTFHQLVEVVAPVKSFVVRSPSVRDKISSPHSEA